MADEPGASRGGKGFWPDWATPRRAWEFMRNVARLERRVEQLRDENHQLRLEMTEMRIGLAEHEAQIKLLVSFVSDSLKNRIEDKIDKIVAEILANNKKT